MKKLSCLALAVALMAIGFLGTASPAKAQHGGHRFGVGHHIVNPFIPALQFNAFASFAPVYGVSQYSVGQFAAPCVQAAAVQQVYAQPAVQVVQTPVVVQSQAIAYAPIGFLGRAVYARGLVSRTFVPRHAGALVVRGRVVRH